MIHPRELGKIIHRPKDLEQIITGFLETLDQSKPEYQSLSYETRELLDSILRRFDLHPKFPALTNEEVSLIQEERLVSAIRSVKERISGLSLQQAKEWVESWAKEIQSEEK